MASNSFSNTASLITSPTRPPILFLPKQHPNIKSQPPKFPRLSTTAAAVSTRAVPQLEKEGDLASRWREIMGSNNWDGLLDPLDPLLRLELIKYGEFSVCTHEAFTSDTYARNYGVCKFQVFDFFDHMLMPKHAGYDVTKFVYCATDNEWWPPFVKKPVNPETWEQNNIWIGFVAASSDETSKKLGRRDICISWRGTSTGLEWGNNFRDYLVPLPADDEFMPNPDPGVKVEHGFQNIYTYKNEGYPSARELVLTEVKRLVNEVYPNEEISVTVTGHSLGGALALLSAYDIVETRVNVRDSGGAVPVSAVTYAGPRLGNSKFKERVEELGLKVLRIVAVADPVPKVPGVIVNENWPEWILKFLDSVGFPWTYTHVGAVLELDSDDSPYLKRPALTNGAPHDLEGYMHLIDGYQGKGKAFKSATGRDIALVNKESDFLLDKSIVAPAWREELNKSMVLNKEGKWVHRSTINSFQS